MGEVPGNAAGSWIDGIVKDPEQGKVSNGRPWNQRGVPDAGAGAPAKAAELFSLIGVDEDFASVIRRREKVVEVAREFVVIGARWWRGDK